MSAEAQERVLTAFRQAVLKLQEGGSEEAIIALEFVLRLDPAFEPARNLQQQLSSGSAEIDLSGIIGQLQAPATEESDELLIAAVEDFNERRFLQAKEKVERVLIDLPGHSEARQLLGQIQDSLKVEAQVGQYLTQARDALDRQDPEEAANFVMMAQAIDPHHPGIDSALHEIRESGVQLPPPEAPAPVPAPAEEPDHQFSFETVGEEPPPIMDGGFAGTPSADEGVSGFDAAFDQEASADFQFAVPEEEDEGASDAEVPEGGADISDLFDAGEEAGEEEDEEPPPPASAPAFDDETRIRELLQHGQEAFDRAEYQEAIDVWSRIFLMDPTHQEALHCVEEARGRKEEVERRVEHLLYEAEEARSAGKIGEARRLVDEVLATQADHLEALDLRDRLAGPEAAEGQEGAPEPVAAPGAGVNEAGSFLDQLDVDLFDESAAEGGPDGPAPALDFGETLAEPAQAVTPSRARGVPWKAIALGAGGLLVVALAVWLGSHMVGGKKEGDARQALERTLARAEELYKQGHAEEAVQMLQEYPAVGLDQARVARRLARYRKALMPPTPTPAPHEAEEAEAAFAEGRLLTAYGIALRGLESHPHDAGLMEMKDRIAAQDRRIPGLVHARLAGDYETAVGMAHDLLQDAPKNAEITDELRRDLFNLAVARLRSYNLTGAEANLEELATLAPDDQEVSRVLDFVAKYKTRPVDMQLKVFIQSLETR